MNNMKQESTRILGLDILRSAAIFFVMITHGARFIPKQISEYYSLLFFDGVWIFFVLSGFLIGNIFIKQMSSEKISIDEIKIFWIKRWTRTLPNYLLFLFICLGIYTFSEGEIWKYFIFVQNLTSNPNTDFFGWSWSLSVEEWFYILLPLVIYLLFKLGFSFKKSILFYIIITIFVISIGRIIQYYSIPNYKYEDFEVIRYSVFYRLDSIMFGVLGAFIYNYYPSFWLKNKKKAMYIGISLLIINFLISKFITYSFPYRILEFTITSSIALLFIPYLNTIRHNTAQYNTTQKLITTFSLISYSLYLVNPIVSDGISYIIKVFFEGTTISKVPWVVIFSISYISFWGISLLLSYIIYHLFEIKATEYLRKKLIK